MSDTNALPKPKPCPRCGAASETYMEAGRLIPGYAMCRKCELGWMDIGIPSRVLQFDIADVQPSRAQKKTAT